MSKKKPIVRERKIAIDPNPRGNLKALGGAQYDDWNNWLASRTSLALPVNQKDDDRATEATVAVYSKMIDLKPADPIEGILISQLVAANQASLEMYRRAWALSSEYFEARTKYLALADKAARTVVMLTERLDHHRGRGQQQITVKHVTVNADQALVAEQVLTGKPDDTALLTAITEKVAESVKPEAAGVGRKKRMNVNPMQAAPRCTAKIKANRAALSCACGQGLEGLPNARCSRWRARGRAKRKL